MWQHLEPSSCRRKGCATGSRNERRAPATRTRARPAGSSAAPCRRFSCAATRSTSTCSPTRSPKAPSSRRPARVRDVAARRLRSARHDRTWTTRPTRSPAAGCSTPPAARTSSAQAAGAHRAQRRASDRRDLVPLEERPPHRRPRRARTAAVRAAQLSARAASATNHYTGYGYWIWVIPLGNGETSIGVVFDKRLDRPAPRGATARTPFAPSSPSSPCLRELLDGAEPRLEDLRFYSHLPYATKQYMGRGWALLGDAAAFLDPYYSPGLDHASFTAEATARDRARRTRGART